MTFVTHLLSVLGFIQVVSADGGASAGTDLTGFLNGGTSLVNWIVSTVPSVVGMIMSNGLLAIGFYILLASLVIGVILRIAGSR